MHPISDKELDKLFQSRFGEFEIEPSEAVWERISGTMDRKSKRRFFNSTFWMAAASVLILMSVGLWFYKPVEVITLHGDTKIANQSMNNSELPFENEVIVSNDDLHHDIVAKPEFKDVRVALVPAIQLKENLSSEAVITVEPGPKLPVLQEQEVLTVAPAPKKVSIPKPVKEPKVPNRYIGDQSTLDVTQPDLMAKAYLSEEESVLAESENREPVKIRSVGSLLNFVIAKVDKREDKFIEFKDGNEGSEVSGINLGLVKIKGRK